MLIIPGYIPWFSDVTPGYIPWFSDVNPGYPIVDNKGIWAIRSLTIRWNMGITWV